MNKKRKKVIGDPKQFRGEFSFVNKDASNIDSKDHNAAVSWHVMNRYERWKKQEDARKQRAAANLLTQSQPSTSSTAATLVRRPRFIRAIDTDLSKIEGGPSNVSYPPSPWHVEDVELGLLNASTPTTAQSWMQNFNYITTSQSLSYTPAPGRYAFNQSSPQNVSRIPTGFPPLVSHILSYAYGVVVPTTWPNEFGKPRWTYEISRTWEDIAAINQDSGYTSALLCFFATLMATATNNKDIASQACFFQVQAMTELRRKLANTNQGSDPMTLKAILRLFSAETALDNTSAARVHLKMLHTFIGTKGGIMTLDPWLRENILATDSYFALKFETRPLFLVGEWTPGPLSHAWKDQLTHTQTLDEHLSNVNMGVEPIDLRNLIFDLRELYRVERYINSHEVAADDNLLRWSPLRRYDCINRLAAHQLSVKIYPHLHLRPKLQLALCTAMALMTAMTLGCPEPVRSGLKMLKELHDKLTEARLESESNPDDAAEMKLENVDQVMFWMFYVGMLAEQVHPMDGTSLWFLHEYDDLALQLDLLSSEGRHEVIRSVLWSSSLEEELNNHRPRRASESRKGVYEACGMTWRAPLKPLERRPSTAEDVEPPGKGKEKA